MRPALVAAVLAALVAGCGSDSSEPAAPPPATHAAKPAKPPKRAKRTGTAIKLANSQYGKVLFDRRGQAIYLFAKEKSSTPRCYGDCAAAWPPVLTRGEPRALGAIRQRLLGTTRRRDGKTQDTYNGHPLYYYAHEVRNEVRCHNITEFGGLWLALNRRGNAL